MIFFSAAHAFSLKSVPGGASEPECGEINSLGIELLSNQSERGGMFHVMPAGSAAAPGCVQHESSSEKEE